MTHSSLRAFRVSRRLVLGYAWALAVMAMFVLPSGASAAWSSVLRVPSSAGASWPAAAVNARGDVAVAWIQEARHHGHATVRVRAAVRAFGAARFSLRTLVARRDLAARGTAVALDARGELTVAWIEQASDNGRVSGPKTIRAAYRVPDGRWSRTEGVGRSSAFNYANPRLAATKRGDVVLTYNARRRVLPGVAASWRSRGRPFEAVQSVPVGRTYLLEPTLAVDSHGTTFLTGTSGCDQRSGDVVVAAAPGRTRRFTAYTTVSRTPGKAVRMAVMAPGTLALSWLSGSCSTTEETGGLPFATTMRNGVVARPAALGDTAATTLIVSPAPGGADVSFVSWPPSAPNGLFMSSRLDTDGAIGPPLARNGAWIALAGDQAGDQLVGQPNPPGSVTTPLAARSATGGAIEPGPFAAVGFPWTAGTVAAQDGRALAALSFQPLSSMTPSIVMAVWRP